MKNLVERMKTNFTAARQDESGDIVQTLLIIALFVAIVVALGKVIYDAIQERAVKTKNCIVTSNPVGGSTGTNC